MLTYDPPSIYEVAWREQGVVLTLTHDTGTFTPAVMTRLHTMDTASKYTCNHNTFAGTPTPHAQTSLFKAGIFFFVNVWINYRDYLFKDIPPKCVNTYYLYLNWKTFQIDSYSNFFSIFK